MISINGALTKNFERILFETGGVKSRRTKTAFSILAI